LFFIKTYVIIKKEENQLIFQINVANIQHDHPDSDLVLFAMGCAASLLAKRLGRTSLKRCSADHALMNLVYSEHQKKNMPEYGGDTMITKIIAVCSPQPPAPYDPDVRCKVFYHINPIDAESRGTLSLDGKTPTPTQSILEVIVRHFLSQQVAVQA
jgi:hypothetical protein